MTTAPLASIIGVGMTPFGKFHARNIRSLANEAVAEALQDSGLQASDIGMIFFANSAAGVLHGQEMIRGQSALRTSGLLGIPTVNIENACASASSAFTMAVMAVRSGTVDVALAVGAEKLTHQDKARSVTALVTAVDLDQDEDARKFVSKSLLGWDLDTAQPAHGDPGQGSKFMDVYAGMTTAYMQESGATIRDLAVIASKSHDNGALNPRAQYQQRISVEEVLASREVAPPLRLLMCSPIGDGAAAVVVCSPEYAASRGLASVDVDAVALVSGNGSRASEQNAVERAATTAYEQAGFGPEDLNVVELHDAAATGELLGYEELGLCGIGDGPKLLASGDTRLGGRIPVNPSGGLLSRGHPVGATGCAQIFELVEQLRGRAGQRQVAGAQRALAQNGGGFLGDDAAAAVVTILSTTRQA